MRLYGVTTKIMIFATRLQRLMKATGVPGAATLRLTDQHAAVVAASDVVPSALEGKAKRKSEKLQRRAPQTLTGAMDALRMNLVMNSPLVQVRQAFCDSRGACRDPPPFATCVLCTGQGRGVSRTVFSREQRCVFARRTQEARAGEPYTPRRDALWLIC
jgi:hypothetical protein